MRHAYRVWTNARRIGPAAGRLWGTLVFDTHNRCPQLNTIGVPGALNDDFPTGYFTNDAGTLMVIRIVSNASGTGGYSGDLFLALYHRLLLREAPVDVDEWQQNGDDHHRW